MEYRILNDGCQIPVMGLGTYKSDGDVCEKIVAEAIETGYQLIDTAAMYGNEEAVGRGIRLSGALRESLFVVTKLSHKTYEYAEAAAEEALKRLGLDYIDLLLLHWPFGNYYAAWRAMERLRERGLVRSIGVSNFEPDRLVDLIDHNTVPPSVNQIETHLLCQRQREKQWMDKYGVAHMGYAPLGHGTKNDMLLLPEVQGLADKYGVTGAQLSLRFQIDSGAVVIPKTSKPERLKENIGVFDFSIEKADMELLRGLDREYAFIGTPGMPEKVEAARGW